MFAGFAQLAGVGLGLHKRSQIIMQNTLAAAAVNIVLNAILIPRFGYTAAGWTTVASYLTLLVLTWWRSRAYMPWRVPWGQVARIVLASLIMAIVVGFVAMLPLAPIAALLIAVAIGLLVYGGALLLVGALRRDELHYVREIVTGLMRRLRHPTSGAE
jgi:O-antigen/teichoic acid export membrane protein